MAPENTAEPEVTETNGEEDGESTTDTDTEGGAETNDDTTEADETPSMTVGDGSLSVSDQSAGMVVTLDSAEFPTSDGWVAIRDYQDGSVGGILGAARYSQSQGLIPEEVPLLRATEAGMTYAAVFFTEDGAVDASGNLTFDPAGDQQIEGTIEVFTAQ